MIFCKQNVFLVNCVLKMASLSRKNPSGCLVRLNDHTGTEEALISMRNALECQRNVHLSALPSSLHMWECAPWNSCNILEHANLRNLKTCSAVVKKSWRFQKFSTFYRNISKRYQLKEYLKHWLFRIIYWQYKKKYNNLECKVVDSKTSPGMFRISVILMLR